MAKGVKGDTVIKESVTHSNVDTALWALYNESGSMKQDIFNRKYKVIEQIVKLESERLGKQAKEGEGSFFDKPAAQ